jgi:hypothetical protein
MKTQSIALITLLASTPAGASIDTSEFTPVDITPQPIIHDSVPLVQRDKCGKPHQMLFILRDSSGAVIAKGVAEVPATC